MPGNPMTSHTLAEAFERVSIHTECGLATAVVSRDYRDMEIEGVRILHLGRKQGITWILNAVIRADRLGA